MRKGHTRKFSFDLLPLYLMVFFSLFFSAALTVGSSKVGSPSEAGLLYTGGGHESHTRPLKELLPIEGKARRRGGHVICRGRRQVCGYVDTETIWECTRFYFAPDDPGPFPPGAYKDPETGLMVIDKAVIEQEADEEGDYTAIYF